MAAAAQEAEVLVLGAGLAGLSAALEARRAGRDVLLVARHAPGRSGNSLLAAGNLSGVFGSGDTEEAFARDTLAGGAGLGDPNLVAALARGSRELVPFLEGIGVPLLGPAGAPTLRSNPGHSVPRTLATRRQGIPHTVGGLALTRPLAEAVRSAGVRFLPGAAEELRVVAGRVCGARIRGREGCFEAAAGAVVLATGGAGRLWAYSDNAADTTGDGLALAYAAGAELRDLEFVQFHPTVASWPVRGVMPTTLFAQGAVLRNRLGERFLAGRALGGEAGLTRDAMSRAILGEVAAGRGEAGGVWLDFSAVAADDLRTYPEVWDALARRGLDPAGQPIRVSPAVHFCMGGVTVDATGATTVPGLFAAGEVAAGVHGANRLGGNALTEALVLGRVAGRSGARPVGPVPPPETGGSARGDGRPTPRELLREVRGLLWGAAGLERSSAGLARGLARCRELGARPEAACPPASAWLTAASLVLEASLRREESRGAHFRSDHPAPCPRWRGSLRVRRGTPEGRPHFRFEAARPPPS